MSLLSYYHNTTFPVGVKPDFRDRTHKLTAWGHVCVVLVLVIGSLKLPETTEDEDDWVEFLESFVLISHRPSRPLLGGRHLAVTGHGDP